MQFLHLAWILQGTATFSLLKALTTTWESLSIQRLDQCISLAFFIANITAKNSANSVKKANILSKSTYELSIMIPEDCSNGSNVRWTNWWAISVHFYPSPIWRLPSNFSDSIRQSRPASNFEMLQNKKIWQKQTWPLLKAGHSFNNWSNP